MTDKVTYWSVLGSLEGFSGFIIAQARFPSKAIQFGVPSGCLHIAQWHLCSNQKWHTLTSWRVHTNIYGSWSNNIPLKVSQVTVLTLPPILPFWTQVSAIFQLTNINIQWKEQYLFLGRSSKIYLRLNLIENNDNINYLKAHRALRSIQYIGLNSSLIIRQIKKR